MSSFRREKIPERILVRSPNWIGDQIMAYPFFHLLREVYPKSHITALCSPWVQHVQFKGAVDSVIVLSKPEERTLLAKWKALEASARRVREQGPWDLGICLPNSFSSAWIFFRAGVKERRGYATDGRRFFLTQNMEWALGPEAGANLHRADAYLRLLPQLPRRGKVRAHDFWGIPPENDLDPEIPGVLKSFNAAKEWPSAQPFEPLKEPYWVLAPGTTAESRQWPLSFFKQLAEKVVEEKGWTGVIIGGAAEQAMAKELAADSQLRLQDWTAKGTPASYWKLFQKARFSLCNDSGMAHVAALCGSPVQVVWGGGDPKRTEPIGPGKVQVIFNPVSCWPCERNTCSQMGPMRLQCLQGVHPSEVWKEILTGIRI